MRNSSGTAGRLKSPLKSESKQIQLGLRFSVAWCILLPYFNAARPLLGSAGKSVGRARLATGTHSRLTMVAPYSGALSQEGRGLRGERGEPAASFGTRQGERVLEPIAPTKGLEMASPRACTCFD